MKNVFDDYYAKLRNQIFEIGVKEVISNALWNIYSNSNLDNLEAWYGRCYKGDNLLGLSKGQFFDTFKTELEARYEEALEKAKESEQ